MDEAIKTGKLEMKKYFGYILLALAVVCWVITPLIPIFKISAKTAVITTLVVAGELFFIGALALLGKELWQKIKAGFKKLFTFSKKE